MLITIDASDDLAIYDQIVRQIKFAVANEVIFPGELVPSVRELATQIAVNPNTVVRAYRELQMEGILETVRGTGLAITKAASKKCREARISLIRERLRAVLNEALQSELNADQIRELIEAELVALTAERSRKRSHS